MQLSALRTHVLDLVQDDSQDDFSDALLNRWLNRSAIHLVGLIKEHAPQEFTKSGTFNTVVDTREYNLLTVNSAVMSDFLDLHFVERSSTTDTSRPRPLGVDRTSDRGRRNRGGNPLYLRSHLLGFYRAPTEISTVTVHYQPSVTEMTAPANDLDALSFQTPRVRDEFADALIFRTASLMLKREDGSFRPFEDEAGAAELAMVKTLRRRVKGAKFMRVLPRRRYGTRGVY